MRCLLGAPPQPDVTHKRPHTFYRHPPALAHPAARGRTHADKNSATFSPGCRVDRSVETKHSQFVPRASILGTRRFASDREGGALWMPFGPGSEGSSPAERVSVCVVVSHRPSSRRVDRHPARGVEWLSVSGATKARDPTTSGDRDHGCNWPPHPPARLVTELTSHTYVCHARRVVHQGVSRSILDILDVTCGVARATEAYTRTSPLHPASPASPRDRRFAVASG